MLIMVVHYYNPDVWEFGEGHNQVQGQPGLLCSFQDNLGYMVTSCLKKKKVKIHQWHTHTVRIYIISALVMLRQKDH